jgi:hypothetical protein
MPRGAPGDPRLRLAKPFLISYHGRINPYPKELRRIEQVRGE